MFYSRVFHSTIRLVFGLFVGLVAGPNVSSGVSFLDDFDDGDPKDGTPVSWISFAGNDVIIENGDLIVANDTLGELAIAAVDNLSVEDVLIETQFRILQGTNAGIGLRYRQNGGCYAADLYPGKMQAGLFRCQGTGSSPVGDLTFVDLDPTQEDVVMRVRLERSGDRSGSGHLRGRRGSHVVDG
jgi:hypothetical protein